MKIRRVCLFCGSQRGNRPVFVDAAKDLARALIEREIGLVYGGGGIGLMGVVADALLDAGLEVIGVIPHGLKVREVEHPRVPDMRVTGDMHERKALMHELSDAIVTLPGGMGTFDELFESLTWSQLGYSGQAHRSPRCRGLLLTLSRAGRAKPISEGFVRPENRELYECFADPGKLLDTFLAREPRVGPDWQRG